LGALPALAHLGNYNLALYFVGLVRVSVAAGISIAFCFATGTLSCLTFAAPTTFRSSSCEWI